MNIGDSKEARFTVQPSDSAQALEVAPEDSCKLFRFKVAAFDYAGPIGNGEHTRAILTTSRLLASAAKRA